MNRCEKCGAAFAKMAVPIQGRSYVLEVHDGQWGWSRLARRLATVRRVRVFRLHACQQLPAAVEQKLKYIQKKVARTAADYRELRDNFEKKWFPTNDYVVAVVRGNQNFLGAAWGIKK